jgi:RecJ-like exonuclease
LPGKFRSLVFVCLALAMGGGIAHAAAALKNFYSGSSMASDGSARTITLQFSEDGTGLYEDNSGKGDIKKNVHWFRDGKKVTVEFEPVSGQAATGPLVFEVQRTSLVPTGAFNAQAGILGFPTLHPFGPATVVKSSGLSTCVNGMPGPCAMRETWSSKQP